ncbi:hypothetical protein GCM10010423_42500 [Streptomyces levis]|uniref:Transmembrane protein n=1 Tax=Streptomyces levis TaxID=285566 RepID=A0ABN3NWA0_9ACTN
MNTPDTPGPPSYRRRRVPAAQNPLRRRSDRFERCFHRFVVLFLLVGLPLAAFAAGRTAYESTMRTVHAQTEQRHEATARLTSGVPGDAEAVRQPAQVRWTEPDGTTRTGSTLVRPGTAEGTTVRIWVDRSGTVVGPPVTAGTAWSNGFFVGSMAAVGLALGLYAVRGGVGLYLDRRRYAQWDAEWNQVEPRWSARFGR